MSDETVDVDEVVQIVNSAFTFLEDMDKGLPGYRERLKNTGPDLRRVKVLAALAQLREHMVRKAVIAKLLKTLRTYAGITE